MNANFVNVKVDREERPDVDDVYMTAFLVYAKAIGSEEGGGWPLSMFLTPDGKPFAGGSYFPPADANGRMGFPSVLKKVTELWRDQKSNVEGNAETLAREVKRIMRPGVNLTAVKPDKRLAAAATAALLASRDPQFGGVDFNPRQPDAAKFPVPAKLALLLYDSEHAKNEEAAATLSLTLDQMARGGIRDHLGGGFHRYSTDRRWHVPHFEKMLYDQAQLAELYADAYAYTGKRVYRDVAEETFRFVLGDMADPSGAFISSLDADTGGSEGSYYVWSIAEVERILGAQDAKVFERVYGMEEPQTFAGGYVLHLPAPVGDIANQMHVPYEALQGAARTRGSQAPRSPPQAHSPLARRQGSDGMERLDGPSFGPRQPCIKRDDYLQAAIKAATFLLEHMKNEQGELVRTGGETRRGFRGISKTTLTWSTACSHSTMRRKTTAGSKRRGPFAMSKSVSSGMRKPGASTRRRRITRPSSPAAAAHSTPSSPLQTR